MRETTSICVFCGSADGRVPDYTAAATAVGTLLAGRGIRLVYGGGRAGLMGRVADAALELGGEAVGIIPQGMVDREVAHRELSELIVTDTMTERKALMAERSTAFLVLPGGFGTLEEFSEVLSWAQIGLHRKPIGFLNVCGYYDGLFAFFDQMVDQGFLRQESRRLVMADEDPGRLVDRLLTRGDTP